MFCNKCGNEYPDNLPGCPYCTPAQPIQPAQPTQPVNHLFPYPHTPQVPFEQPKKKSKLPIIIIAVILVAAIIAGAIFLPGLLKKDEDESNPSAAPGEKLVTMYVAESAEVETIANMAMSMKFEYGEGGLPTLITMTADGETMEIRMEYDMELNTMKTTEYLDGEEISSTLSQADENDLVTKTISYEDGVETGYTLYEYDEKGNNTKQTNYEDGKEIGYKSFEYNANGDVTKESEYAYGEEAYTIVYEYNAEGKILKSTRTAPYEDEYVHAYEYDEKGNCIKETHMTNGQDMGYDLLTYDENGNCITKATTYMGVEAATTTVKYTTVEIKEKDVKDMEEFQNEFLSMFNFFG